LVHRRIEGIEHMSNPDSAGIRNSAINELHKPGNITIDPRTGKPAKFAIALSEADYLAALQRRAWRQDQTPTPVAAPTAPATPNVRDMTDAEFAIAMKNKVYRRK
jgi:hypothetical protein